MSNVKILLDIVGLKTLDQYSSTSVLCHAKVSWNFLSCQIFKYPKSMTKYYYNFCRILQLSLPKRHWFKLFKVFLWMNEVKRCTPLSIDTSKFKNTFMRLLSTKWEKVKMSFWGFLNYFFLDLFNKNGHEQSILPTFYDYLFDNFLFFRKHKPSKYRKAKLDFYTQKTVAI